MGSDVQDDQILNEESDLVEVVEECSHPNKRKCVKVPKKIMKAERERLKREQLNELFSKLASVLELNQENNGKASVLNETIRLMKEMFCNIQSLRKENATLLSESQYMTAEKDELKEENTTLEVQIKNMQNELKERIGQSKPDLNISPPECWQTDMPSHFVEAHRPQMTPTDPSTQQSPILGPLYVIPINPDLQAFQKIDAASVNSPITVSKPHARYPTPADSWPLQLLPKQPKTAVTQSSS
ncbi:transcription factor bHLH47 isoform X1 [Amaranthus tricolor]|uniref:transcription factor bHLH47 isoform X1 n=2 Tax=Amaranthus tricolor TaxID=29722 RepID=UPI00258BA5BD|nr:transcription factor bHLH47 isoform X1 [Amaranthus tricolor]